jgi:O-antigen ligase
VISRSRTARSCETMLFVRFSDDRWLFFLLAVILFVFLVLVGGSFGGGPVIVTRFGFGQAEIF